MRPLSLPPLCTQHCAALDESGLRWLRTGRLPEKSSPLGCRCPPCHAKLRCAVLQGSAVWAAAQWPLPEYASSLRAATYGRQR